MAVKMVDRLAELRSSKQYSQLHDGYDEDVPMDEIRQDFSTEYCAQLDEAENAPLQEFFSIVNDLRHCIAEISSRNEEIKQVQRNILSKPPGMYKEDKEKHVQLIEEVKRYSKRVQQGLKKIEGEIKTEEKSFDGASMAQFRIKKSQFTSLAYQLKQVMMDFRHLEDDHKEKSTNSLRRQLRAINPENSLSDDQVEDAIETEYNIVTQSDHHRAILDDVEARKKEILELEQNIQELNGMFFDMMILIDEQGEMINQIEHTVTTAADYVYKGEKETATAAVYKRQHRRLKFAICLILSFVIVFVIVVLVVGGAVAAKYLSNPAKEITPTIIAPSEPDITRPDDATRPGYYTRPNIITDILPTNFTFTG